MLAIAATAVLTGARSFTAIGEWIADAPAQVMTALEIRQAELTAVPRPPHEATVRRVLEIVDATAWDTAITTWLTARLQAQAGTTPTSHPSGNTAGESRWTARRCAAQKNAHYMLIVKKNQPTLHTQLKRLLWKQVPTGDRRRERGHGRDERRTRKVLGLT